MYLQVMVQVDTQEVFLEDHLALDLVVMALDPVVLGKVHFRMVVHVAP